MTTFQPSKYQQAIFDWIKARNRETRRKARHLVVTAGPGSGKTTTLVEAARLIENKHDAVFVAFNKHIQVELQEKLPGGMTANTLHSLGYKAIIREFQGKAPKIEPNLHKTYAQDWLLEHQDQLQLDSEAWAGCQGTITKLINLCQLTLTDCRDIDGIWEGIQHYGLDLVEIDIAISALPDIFNRIIREAKKQISFNEMIWLPISQNWRLRQYGAVLADECQDFNRVQRELVKRIVKPSGFCVFVGDSKQSLYGFVFASTRSVDEIIEETGAETLPLSICYRCPRSHVELAASIFADEDYHLEARHDAPEGEIRDIYDFQVVDLIKSQDLVICRVNAPLISLCFQLIREGIGARIKGRDIGANLIALVKRIDKASDSGVNWKNPYTDIRAWAEYEKEKIRRKYKDADEADMACETIQDKADTILAVWEGKQPGSTSGMTSAIERLFADNGATVWLSTIHKAKGLEASAVFILKPSKMPHPMAKKAWEIEQEHNAQFVAYSRAKDSLYFAWNQDEPGCPAIPMPEDMEPEQGDLLELSLNADYAA